MDISAPVTTHFATYSSEGKTINMLRIKSKAVKYKKINI